MIVFFIAQSFLVAGAKFDATLDKILKKYGVDGSAELGKQLHVARCVYLQALNSYIMCIFFS